MFQQIRHNLSGCFTKRVGENACNADIGNGHTVLDSVFLRRFHTHQFEAVSCEFSKLAKILRRNKGASDQIEFIKVSDPFGILFISLLAFDGFDVFRVCKTHLNVVSR